MNFKLLLTAVLVTVTTFGLQASYVSGTTTRAAKITPSALTVTKTQTAAQKQAAAAKEAQVKAAAAKKTAADKAAAAKLVAAKKASFK